MVTKGYIANPTVHHPSYIFALQFPSILLEKTAKLSNFMFSPALQPCWIVSHHTFFAHLIIDQHRFAFMFSLSAVASCCTRTLYNFNCDESYNLFR
jgi:hypothetical protein